MIHMRIKSLPQKKIWRGQRVLLRVDFNVPLVKGRISEDFRISAALPSIKYLQEKGARLIIVSHLGDPTEPSADLSTRVLAKRLQKLLKSPVKFVPELLGQQAEKASLALRDGEILFLENLRFHPGEKANNQKFAKGLAALADVYVNDAFSVCHRAQASVSAITRYLPAFAGLQLTAEVKNLQKIMRPRKPLVVVMGGAKISTKAPIIKKLYPRASQILLGGGLANAFFRHQGIEIGKSIYDEKANKIVASFFKSGKIWPKINLPVDVVVCGSGGQSLNKALTAVKKNDKIFDIGPDSVALFSSYLKKAQTIVWNGPLGKFEDSAYKHGTIAIGVTIAARSTGRAFGLVGGGETVEAMKMTKMEWYGDWISSAGGAR